MWITHLIPWILLIINIMLFIQHPCRWMEKFSWKSALQEWRGTPWNWAIWRGASPLGIIPGTNFDKNWYSFVISQQNILYSTCSIADLIIVVLSYSKRDDVLQTSFSPSGFSWYGQRWRYEYLTDDPITIVCEGK